MSNVIVLFPSILYAAAACLAFLGPNQWPGAILRWVEGLAVVAFASAIAAACFYALPAENGLPGLLLDANWVRADLVSLVMLILVTFIGWVVLRFSANYLDGETRQGSFTGWMAATLSAVTLLVASATLWQLVLAWIASSLFLHRLLLFYPDRPAARRVARKTFLVSRASDLCLIVAALLLTHAYGTTDIGTIMAAARAGVTPDSAVAAAALLALAAVLKSAQFPTHGWLTEVMEAPTPVSALLHAGVVNGGGFLLIRFADVMLNAPMVLALLAMIGGMTALFGALVMLTQSAVKTSLGWSTVAQMGFMILQCGLALFPIALLHIVAHSLYKAHAFLSSGSAVEDVMATRRPGPVAVPGGAAVARAFLVALLIYGLIGFLFGFWDKPPQALALGAILIFGVAYLVAQGFADTAPMALTRRVSLYAACAATSYFALQWGAYHLMQGTLPQAPEPGRLEWSLLILSVVSFGAVAVTQSLFPRWAHHPALAGVRVHLANGLYVNALFDRLLGHYRTQPSALVKE